MSDPITDAVTTTAGAGDTPGTAAGGGTSAASTTPEGRTFTQEDVNRLLAEERRKADEKRRADEARARAQAAEEAAAKSGEWQTLAEQRKAAQEAAERRAQEIEARLAAANEVINASIKARAKGLPDELRALLPADDADPATRLATLEKLEIAARKLSAQATPGTPAGPRGTGGIAQVAGVPDADILAQKRRMIGGL